MDDEPIPSDPFEFTGRPIVVGQAEKRACPRCFCQTVYSVIVPVRVPHTPLTDLHYTLARYVGCPACPWKSETVLNGHPNS